MSNTDETTTNPHTDHNLRALTRHRDAVEDAEYDRRRWLRIQQIIATVVAVAIMGVVWALVSDAAHVYPDGNSRAAGERIAAGVIGGLLAVIGSVFLFVLHTEFDPDPSTVLRRRKRALRDASEDNAAGRRVTPPSDGTGPRTRPRDRDSFYI